MRSLLGVQALNPSPEIDGFNSGREREAVRKRRKAQKKLHEYHLTFRAMARGAHHFALLCIQCWGSRALRRKIIRERNYGAAHRAARRLGVLQHSIQR